MLLGEASQIPDTLDRLYRVADAPAELSPEVPPETVPVQEPDMQALLVRAAQLGAEAARANRQRAALRARGRHVITFCGYDYAW